MPLDLSFRSELAKPLLKLILETVQLTRRTTWTIKCHVLLESSTAHRLLFLLHQPSQNPVQLVGKALHVLGRKWLWPFGFQASRTKLFH